MQEGVARSIISNLRSSAVPNLFHGSPACDTNGGGNETDYQYRRMAVTPRLTMIAATMLLLLPFATMNAGVADDGGPRIDRAWARATPGAARTGAVYFKIESPTADRLIGLASPVAAKAELHTNIETNGVMQMREVEGGLALPAGQVVELKPGGALHVMLTELNQRLKAGDTFTLTLTFETAGTRDVNVKVERLGAMGPTDDGAMNHAATNSDSDHPAKGAKP
jgi:periplasmic copper chaperone A